MGGKSTVYQGLERGRIDLWLVSIDSGRGGIRCKKYCMSPSPAKAGSTYLEIVRIEWRWGSS
jgi:hypothetical protein